MNSSGGFGKKFTIQLRRHSQDSNYAKPINFNLEGISSQYLQVASEHTKSCFRPKVGKFKRCNICRKSGTVSLRKFILLRNEFEGGTVASSAPIGISINISLSDFTRLGMLTKRNGRRDS